MNGTGPTYIYDGGGLRARPERSRRVKKVVGSITTRYIFSGLPAQAGTKVIAEYPAAGAPASPTKEYIYSGSALLVTIEGSTTKYHHQDHLSVRVTTDSNGDVAAEQGHYPFGESWYQGSGGTKWQFTSYERDGESGLDYAMFRYDSSRLGRFMTPDPIAGSLGDPQSLNRYAYTRNDPINLVDPLGLHINPLIEGGGRWRWRCTWDQWRWESYELERGSAVTMFGGYTCRLELIGGEQGGGGGVTRSTKKEESQLCDAQLPSDADAALLARVIFAEATSSGISDANSKLEMAAIGFAAVNRQALVDNGIRPPSTFGASGTTLEDILNPAQFGSVGGARFNLAGDPSQIDSAQECDNLKRAIETARNVLSRRVGDPFANYGGTYAFRTRGRGGPGGDYHLFPPEAQIPRSGNIFYGFGPP